MRLQHRPHELALGHALPREAVGERGHGVGDAADAGDTWCFASIDDIEEDLCDERLLE